MKKLLTFILLIGTFSMVGCHDSGSQRLHKLLEIFAEVNGGGQGDLWNDTGLADGDSEAISIADYHPVSGKHRLVLEVIRTDGDNQWFGLDMSGFNDLLKDIKGKNHLEINDKLVEFLEHAVVDELNRGGLVGDQDYYEQNSGELFAESGQFSKDLESIGAKIEMNSAQDLSENLVADYGLSEGRAQKVARTINAYKRITSKRTLTEREQNAYTQELLGVDYQKAEDAFMRGGDFDQLMERAAEKNGTSPEQVSAIVRDMLL